MGIVCHHRFEIAQNRRMKASPLLLEAPVYGWERLVLLLST